MRKATLPQGAWLFFVRSGARYHRAFRRILRSSRTSPWGFDDQQEVIATAYLLNQDPKRQAFQSVDDYKTLRDGFVRDFTACMAAISG